MAARLLGMRSVVTGLPSLNSLAILGGHVVSPVESICARLTAAATEEPSWASLL